MRHVLGHAVGHLALRGGQAEAEANGAWSGNELAFSEEYNCSNCEAALSLSRVMRNASTMP